jgi:hypothetical protein
MALSVGIGIVSCHRKGIVSETIDRVRASTRQPGAALVVAEAESAMQEGRERFWLTPPEAAGLCRYDGAPLAACFAGSDQ